MSGEASDGSDPSIKVCVRVRPFIREELEGSRSGGTTRLCVSMPTKTACNLVLEYGEEKTFTFDRCYWSHSTDHELYANQDTIYQELGEDMLKQAVNGFNNCIFAYGQTGTGKSFSVLGGKAPDSEGLLPRIVAGLFEHFKAMDDNIKKACHVSFFEIYNEQIKDLLAEQEADKKLAIREHPTLGAIIIGLTESPVENREQVLNLVDYGTQMRHTSATAMNSESSRSHCVFSFTSKLTTPDGAVKVSTTHLVDLAGSERAGRTKASGARLKEGAAINASLSVLARVISDLAKKATQAKSKKKGQVVNPPFRQSKLTHILKESLSGNSKTVMMAAISPNLPDVDETISTLKFCQTVKLVQTSAKKNELNEKGLQAQLQTELEALKKKLADLESQRQEEGITNQKALADAMKAMEVQKEMLDRYNADWDKQLQVEALRSQKREKLISEGNMANLKEIAASYHAEDSDSSEESTDSSEESGDSQEEFSRVAGSRATIRRCSMAMSFMMHQVGSSISQSAAHGAGSAMFAAPALLLLAEHNKEGVSDKDRMKVLNKQFNEIVKDIRRIVKMLCALSVSAMPTVDLVPMVALETNMDEVSFCIRASKLEVGGPTAPPAAPRASQGVDAGGDEGQDWLSVRQLKDKLTWLTEFSLQYDLDNMVQFAENEFEEDSNGKHDEEAPFASAWEAWRTCMRDEFFVNHLNEETEEPSSSDSKVHQQSSELRLLRAELSAARDELRLRSPFSLGATKSAPGLGGASCVRRQASFMAPAATGGGKMQAGDAASIYNCFLESLGRLEQLESWAS